MAPDLQTITMQYMEEHQIQEIFEVSSRLYPWILAVSSPRLGHSGSQPSNLGPLPGRLWASRRRARVRSGR